MKSAAVASLIMCFAAGADIVEMSSRTYMECYKSDMFDAWEGVAKTNKPVIAAVNGVFAPPHVCENRPPLCPGGQVSHSEVAASSL